MESSIKHKENMTAANTQFIQYAPIVQREILYQWTAPIRYFRMLDKKKYLLIVACVLGFFVILVILGQYWFMAAIAALMFLVYVVGTVPPVMVTHRLTTLGIETLEKEYKWETLDTYWFSQKDRQKLLNVETKTRLPGRLIMLVPERDMVKVNDIMRKRLRYKDIRNQSRVSKVTDGIWMDYLDGKEERPIRRPRIAYKTASK